MSKISTKTAEKYHFSLRWRLRCSILRYFGEEVPRADKAGFMLWCHSVSVRNELWESGGLASVDVSEVTLLFTHHRFLDEMCCIFVAHTTVFLCD